MTKACSHLPPLSRDLGCANSWSVCVNTTLLLGCTFPKLPASECYMMKAILLTCAVIGGGCGPVSPEVIHVESVEDGAQLGD